MVLACEHMRLRRSVAELLVLGALSGCGPEVVGPAADTSTGASTAGPATTTGDASITTNEAPATTSSTSSTSADGGSTSTTGDDAEGSTTGEPICGCPDTPITFETELQAGFTPAEALAPFQGAAVPLQWVAYEGMPETVLHVEAAYVGGAVGEGPGGSDECVSFMEILCSDGVTIEVELTLLSDDGAIDTTVPAQVQGTPDQGFRIYVDSVDIATNAGALASWPLLVRGRPFELADLSYYVGEVRSGELYAYVMGRSAVGAPHLLGETP